MAKVSAANRVILAAIVAATQANTAHFVAEKAAKALAKDGLITIHPAAKNANGEPQVMATEAGIKFTAETPAPTPRATPVVPTGGFQIISGFAMPENKPRGRQASTYPFEQLELGQSFFIAATEDNPTPWRRMNSTVSSANKRFKEANPVRHFRVAEVEYNGVKGAMIARINPPAPTPAA